MKRMIQLGIAVFVVSWTGHRFQERPCTEEELTEQKLVVCEDRHDERFSREFEAKEDAEEFMQGCPVEDCEAMVVEEVARTDGPI